MMPKAPTAQCSKPPPVNMLYMPRKPPPLFCPALDSKNLASASPSSPGTGTREVSTTMVKMIRDFSSGILKQLLSVLMMEVNIYELTERVFPPVAPVWLVRLA